MFGLGDLMECIWDATFGVLVFGEIF